MQWHGIFNKAEELHVTECLKWKSETIELAFHRFIEIFVHHPTQSSVEQHSAQSWKNLRLNRVHQQRING